MFFCVCCSWFAKKNKTENKKYFSITAIGSTIWGIVFCFLLIQTDFKMALLCRSIGMVGLFFFFVFGPKFLLELTNSPKWLRKIVTIYSFAGLILYLFLILVVTANAVDGACDFYIEQGFTDYISKPIDSDYLNIYQKIKLK